MVRTSGSRLTSAVGVSLIATLLTLPGSVAAQAGVKSTRTEVPGPRPAVIGSAAPASPGAGAPGTNALCTPDT